MGLTHEQVDRLMTALEDSITTQKNGWEGVSLMLNNNRLSYEVDEFNAGLLRKRVLLELGRIVIDAVGGVDE